MSDTPPRALSPREPVAEVYDRIADEPDDAYDDDSEDDEGRCPDCGASSNEECEADCESQYEEEDDDE